MQIDHINGGGVRDQLVNGHSVWRLRRAIMADLGAACAKYQVLCANCNWIKRFTNNEHANMDKDKFKRSA